MTTYVIPQKMSNSGSIHDIESDLEDREIKFTPGCIYAVVRAAYYGGKGYTTHRTEEAAVRASQSSSYSHKIIDRDGNEYACAYGYWSDRLVRRS